MICEIDFFGFSLPNPPSAVLEEAGGGVSMTDEVEPLDAPVAGAAAGVGGASSGSSTSSPNQEEVKENE
jgi:hypothetical protein